MKYNSLIKKILIINFSLVFLAFLLINSALAVSYPYEATCETDPEFGGSLCGCGQGGDKVVENNYCIPRASQKTPTEGNCATLGFIFEKTPIKIPGVNAFYCIPTEERIKGGEALEIKCPPDSKPIYKGSSGWEIFKGEPEVKATHCLMGIPQDKCDVLSQVKEGPNYRGCSVAPDQTIGEKGIFGTLGEVTQKVSGYKVQFDIPCPAGQCKEIVGETTPARYIVRLYQFGLMIVGLLAFGSIIYGGLKYILAAGSFTSVEEAKEHIKSAIYGLILLLGAATILMTIDPGFLNIQNPQLEPLKNIPPPETSAQTGNKPGECLANQEKKDGKCVCKAGYVLENRVLAVNCVRGLAPGEGVLLPKAEQSPQFQPQQGLPPGGGVLLP